MAYSQFEQKIIQFENKTLNKLLSLKCPITFVFTLFSLTAPFLIFLWTKTDFPGWSKLYILQDRIWALVLLVLGAFFSYSTPQRMKVWCFFTFMTASWLIPVYILDSFRLAVLAPIIFVLINTFSRHYFRKNKFLLFLFLTISFLGLIVFLAFDVLNNKDGKIFQYFSILHLEAIFIYFLNSIYTSTWLVSLNFNPLQFFFPLPLPEETSLHKDPQEKKILFIKGALYLIEAQVVFLILFSILKFFNFVSAPNTITSFYLFLLTLIGGMKVCTALLWMYGFNTPATSDFIFFAKSPLETWQRGSVFMAKFIFSKIYLPLWVRFRNNILPSVASILFILFNLFFFHELLIANLLKFFFPSLNFVAASLSSIKQELTWALLWIVWIVLFHYTLSKLKVLHTTKWGSCVLILTTHLGNMSIIPMALYLSNTF